MALPLGVCALLGGRALSKEPWSFFLPIAFAMFGSKIVFGVVRSRGLESWALLDATLVVAGAAMTIIGVVLLVRRRSKKIKKD